MHLLQPDPLQLGFSSFPAFAFPQGVAGKGSDAPNLGHRHAHRQHGARRLFIRAPPPQPRGRHTLLGL